MQMGSAQLNIMNFIPSAAKRISREMPQKHILLPLNRAINFDLEKTSRFLMGIKSSAG